MSFLSNGLELVVSPAILPVAVPCMLHHLARQRYNRELVRLMNTKQHLGAASAHKHNRCLNWIYNRRCTGPKSTIMMRRGRALNLDGVSSHTDVAPASVSHFMLQQHSQKQNQSRLSNLVFSVMLSDCILGL